MRLTFSLLFILFTASFSFAQDLSDSSRYSKIVLDGKEAYIDIQTGGIVYPNQANTVIKSKPEVVHNSEPVIVQSRTSAPIDKASYTVKKGDTLYSIARRYGMNASYLASTNGLSLNSALRVGQRLVVEPTSIPSTYITPVAKPEGVSETPEIYTVKKDDTLYSIALKYSISAKSIADYNGISLKSILRVGQRLRISDNTMQTQSYADTYIVKKGDTLYSIARKSGITVYELKRLNSLSSNSLRIGQILKTR